MYGFLWRYVAAVLLGGAVAGGLYYYNEDDSDSATQVAEVNDLSQAIIPIEQPERPQVTPEPEAVEPAPEPVAVEPTPEPIIAEPAPEPEIVEPTLELVEVASEPEPEVEASEPEPVEEQVVVENVPEAAPEVVEPTPEPAAIETAVEPEIAEADTNEAEPEPIIAEPVAAEEAPTPEVIVAAVEPEPEIVVSDPTPVVEEPVLESETAVEPNIAEPAVEVASEPVVEVPETSIIVDDNVITATQEPADSSVQSDASAPTFDIVRVDNSGAAVVAGTAMPNSTVSIMSDGEKIGEATADTAGEFVAIVVTPSSESSQTIELEAELDGQLLFSDESILILPPLDTNAADNIVTDISPAIVKATADEVVVIQPSTVLSVDQISIDSINYDELGEVSVAGRGTPNSEVFLYVDDALMANTIITQSGNWKIELHNLTAGNYIMRADEMAVTGGVSSRMETPFQRAYPEDVREAKAESAAPTYTVQPGNSLWVIATSRYGEGTKYTQIFSANQDQIRNPDLIYPGQVFSLPDGE